MFLHVFLFYSFFLFQLSQLFFPILSFIMRDEDKIIENLRRILFEENEELTPILTSTSTSTLIVKPKKAYITVNDYF